ncbi:MAG: tRNA lysidine(34) synthetase TilS [Calditrichaeota bacterium]|nr:MAG: tRNA lysidine(34) synthetase TilS [Calditrichota bacterium]
MTRSLEHAFLRFVNENRLIEPNRPLGVAVSGGMDSVVLLHLLNQWRARLKVHLYVLHVHHGLRGQEADEDLLFVENLAEQLCLPFSSARMDVRGYARSHRLSLEEAGHLLREQQFLRWRDELGLQAVATGHHADDQAETLLMRLIQGTGIEGLAGIRLKKPGLVRPLLFARRSEIQHFALRRGLAYREDPSNRNMRFLRNRIRHRLMPLLREEFGFDPESNLLHLSLVVQDWVAFMEPELENLKKQINKARVGNQIELDISVYQAYFSWLRVRLLEQILQEILNRPYRLSYRRFHQFDRWVQRAQTGAHYALHPAVWVWRRDDRLVFLPEAATDASLDPVSLEPEGEFELPEFGLRITVELLPREAVEFTRDRTVEFLDAAQLEFPLLLRRWQPGDRFVPLGMSGSRLVSDFLTDRAVRGPEKRQVPVLVSGHRIVAVLGQGIDDRFKVKENTKRVLKIQVERI